MDAPHGGANEIDAPMDIRLTPLAIAFLQIHYERLIQGVHALGMVVWRPDRSLRVRRGVV